MALTDSPINSNSRNNSTAKYQVAFILVASLFFFWGFVHNLDPILIPHLRKAFQLSDLESSLIDTSIFIAYFVMALPAGFIMKKYGFKSGIILGLFLFASGCFLFIPAADTQQYVFFLGALFIIACGLTFLETAANPYATLLGPPETATQRLNLAQSFNGLAVVVAPIIGKKFILSGTEYTDAQMQAMNDVARAAYLQSEAASVKMPYLIVGCIILLVGIIFYFMKLPDYKDETFGESKHTRWETFRHRHLRWAVVAQFFYVGAQVCVGSFFIKMCAESAGLNEKSASDYLAWGYGLAFLVGRFSGTFFMRYLAPHKLLAIYATINICLSALAIFGEGMMVVYSLIGISFFMSIMFPTIFSLGIHNLGNETKIASSLIVMSIVGGALLPPVLAYISDATGSIQNGYVVPLFCFVVVLYFGLRGYKVREENAQH